MLEANRRRAGPVAAVLGSAHAGLYTDDLARCLVDSTSKDDRVALVRWMFVAAAAHPAVASIANVSPKDREEADKKLATLFMRLLTDSCKEEGAEGDLDGRWPDRHPAEFRGAGSGRGTRAVLEPRSGAVDVEPRQVRRQEGVRGAEVISLRPASAGKPLALAVVSAQSRVSGQLPAGRVAGLSLSFTMNTRIFAGCVVLAFAERRGGCLLASRRTSGRR